MWLYLPKISICCINKANPNKQNSNSLNSIRRVKNSIKKIRRVGREQITSFLLQKIRAKENYHH